MANTKISALNSATALTGTEVVPLNQSGTTKRTTAQAIANLAPATDISGKENVGVAAGFVNGHESAYTHANIATAYSHSQAAHAPADATAAGAAGDAHAGTAHAPADAEKNVQADWNQADTGADSYIANKPTIPAAYTHPTGDGNMHVPANSTTNGGKVLTAGATAGSYAWETPASTYTLPIATDAVLGGVKQGTNITIDEEGVISSTGSGAVDSVNGQTGTVVLNATDVGALSDTLHGLSDDEYNYIYGQLPGITRQASYPILSQTTDPLATGTPDYLCLLYLPGGILELGVIYLEAYFAPDFPTGTTLRLISEQNQTILKSMSGFGNFNDVGETITLADDAAVLAAIAASPDINQLYRTQDSQMFYLNINSEFNDYIELTNRSMEWLIHSQNFLDWMDGKLAWSKIDKSGANKFVTSTLNPNNTTDVGKVVKVANDGTYELGTAAVGSGDVVGPASAVVGNFATFSNIDGKHIQDGLINTNSFAPALGGDDNYVTDAEKAALHAAVTITDSTSINLSLTGQALSADALFGTTTGTVCQGDDSRLSNSRTPTAHAASHILTGTDPLTTNPWHGVVSRSTVAPLPTSLASTTFTLACNTTPLQYYYKGKLVTVSAAKTVTIGTGKYWVYFTDDTGTLTAGNSFPDQYENVLVATVMWNGTLGLVGDERHNHRRDIEWHLATHEGIGTRYVSGGVFAYAGTTNSTTTFSMTASQVNDEDIKFADTTPFTTARIFYETAPVATVQNFAWINTLSAKPYYGGAADASGVYAIRGDTFTQVTITANNRYFNYFVYHSTDVLNPIYILAETVTAANIGGYTTAALARAVSPPNIGTSNLTTELKLFYRIVVNGVGLIQTPVAADDYRSGGSIPGGGVASTSHNTLANLELAGTGVTFGHIDDQAQTIAGAKTFTNGVVATVTGTASGNPSTTSLAALSTGLVKVTTTTGSLSAAAAADVTGYAITGFTSGAGTVADTDTILQAINKLDGNVGGKQAADAQLTSLAGLSYTGNALKVISVNAGETDFELATPSAGGSSLNVALMPGSFNLIGAAAEPLLQGNDGTNIDYPSLEFIDGATELNAFFTIPSKRTAQYGGTANIKIDIDFALVGATLTNTHTVIFGVGLIELNAGTTIDTAPPTSSTGYASATYTLGASETTLFKRTLTVEITADASISAGQTWLGRLIRKTGTDTSVANARVLGITVYE